jgi:threonine-phosphate decarboxylase
MAWIEKFGHGGDLHTASEVFGIHSDEFLDYSANINPLGPPPALLERLTKELGNLIHYPDPAHRSLRTKLAHQLKLPSDCLLIGNGAAECMALAVQGLPIQKIGVIYPCFSEYTQLAAQHGKQVIGCYGKQDNLFKPDKEELRELFNGSDLVFIGHPNNPTGILYDMHELLEMAEWTKQTGTYMVVDEAFLDFIEPDRQPSLIARIEEYPLVLLIRSMTKFYAIPGLRLGYVVAHPSVIAQLRNKQVTWSVNQFALVAGEVCIDLPDYEIATRQLIARERAFLYEAIETKLGWQVWPGAANFLLIRLPHVLTADDLQWKLGRSAIMIRNCSVYPGLSVHDIRIAVRSNHENQRLLAALERINKGDAK